MLFVGLRAGCQAPEAFASILHLSLLARCAFRGSGGRGAGGGGARGRGRRGSSRTPSFAARGAGRGADGSGGL